MPRETEGNKRFYGYVSWKKKFRKKLGQRMNEGTA